MATTDKYDRQLRIWGAHGQQNLIDCHLVLLGCSPVGVETVKNLILPGVGNVLVVDNQSVSVRDTQNNFFVSPDSVGQPRAKIVQELLCELNPDVVGSYEVSDPALFQIQTKHTLIIANEFSESDCENLSKRCHESKSNVIYLNTVGFIGKIRLQAYDHFIIESKPMGLKYDLRIAYPFPELDEYFNSVSLEQDHEQLSHVPYVVLLRKALLKYHQQHQKYPQKFSEKQEFIALIKEMGTVLPLDYRENFFEAAENYQQGTADFRFIPESEVDSVQEVMQLLEDKRIEQPSDVFWKMMAAFKRFINENGGQPPLPRLFPDMKCFTNTYIHLKKDIYGAKCERDFQLMKEYVPEADDDTLRTFIDNVLNIKCVNYRPYHEEIQSVQPLDDWETDLYKWYMELRCSGTFEERRAKQTQISQQLEVDVNDENLTREMVRFEDSKLPVIAAVLGGIAAQEATKIITKQFVPINNTLVFNGLNGQASIYMM